MRTVCILLALLTLLAPTTAFGQEAYAGASCAEDDNECLLRALLFQTRALVTKRLADEHLQAALDAKTAEAQALQAALAQEQKASAKVGGNRAMWAGVGAFGGIVLTTLIVFVTNRASK